MKKKNNSKKLKPIQKVLVFYAVSFFAIVSLSFIPGVVDDHGLMFGLYHIDPIDDALHFLSGVWAIWAAFTSVAASLVFFRWFGSIYFLDGVYGLLTGKNFLNLHIFTSDPAVEVASRFGVNFPHLLIGGSAMLFGMLLYKKLSK